MANWNLGRIITYTDIFRDTPQSLHANSRLIRWLGHHLLRNRKKTRLQREFRWICIRLWHRQRLYEHDTHKIVITLQIQKCDILCCCVGQFRSSWNPSAFYFGATWFEYRPGKFLSWDFSLFFLVPPSHFWQWLDCAPTASFRVTSVIHASPYHWTLCNLSYWQASINNPKKNLLILRV
jgi:hypothetical protein